MIFVTVGNATQPFPRLLNAIEHFAGKFCLRDEDEIFIQSGNNPDFHPTNCQYESFISMETFEQYMKRSDLIIAHGGCGTLLHALGLGKVPVVVPRRKKYGEHINDHQVQLTQVLANEGRVVPLYEIADLPRAVSEARHHQIQPLSPTPPRILELVSIAIEELVSQS